MMKFLATCRCCGKKFMSLSPRFGTSDRCPTCRESDKPRDSEKHDAEER